MMKVQSTSYWRILFDNRSRRKVIFDFGLSIMKSLSWKSVTIEIYMTIISFSESEFAKVCALQTEGPLFRSWPRSDCQIDCGVP